MAGSLTDRMLGAAMLNVPTYEEVEHDETATGQAATVVAIVAVAGAIGAAGSRGGIGAIIGALIAAFLGWLIWAGVTYLVGTALFGGQATWGELLRTLGFAQSPGVLNVLGFIPVLGWLVTLVVGIWTLVTGIVAIRQALDFSTGKAILTAVVAWLAGIIVFAILAAIGLGAAGVAGAIGR